MAEQVDVIVIGSGQGGLPLAEEYAQGGKRVVLFEREAVGGSCINWGCTPSKALLAAAHAAGRAREAKRLGIHAAVNVDFGAVMRRVRKIRDAFRQHDVERVEKAGIRLVMEEASFVGPRTVRGGATTVTAPLVVIDTGTTAAIPSIDGLAKTPYATNHTIFDWETCPPRLAVIGGGYIGLELGQAMCRLGSAVTIVEPGERILGREERDASQALHDALVADGVKIELGRPIRGVSSNGGTHTLQLADESTIEAEALLVATGRRPNTEALNAGASGIELDEHGFVRIDERFHTTCEGVYAIGDVAGQPQFTHVSYEDYQRVTAIVRGEDRRRDDRVLAYTTFTEPHVARVGLTIDAARAKGLDARVVTLPLGEVARAIEWDLERGFYRLVVGADDRIMGATLVGYEAGELVHVILAHMEAGATWKVLERSVHIHPTFAEGLPSMARLLLD